MRFSGDNRCQSHNEHYLKCSGKRESRKERDFNDMQEKATQEKRESGEIYFNNIKKLHKFISFMYR